MADITSLILAVLASGSAAALPTGCATSGIYGQGCPGGAQMARKRVYFPEGVGCFGSKRGKVNTRGSTLMNVYALIEELSNPDESLLFFRELPGCFVTAPTTREAIQQAPGAVAEYARWLKQHNIFFLEKDVSSITIVGKEILREESV